MYTPTGIVLDAAALDSLVRVALSVDLAFGESGSGMSNFQKTTERLRPLLLTYGLLLGRELLKATIVSLNTSAQIVAHRDPAIAGERFHLPLVSNPGCWWFHGGTWQQLEVGKLYRMDPAVEHGAVNWGEAPRFSLMYDLGVK